MLDRQLASKRTSPVVAMSWFYALPCPLFMGISSDTTWLVPLSDVAVGAAAVALPPSHSSSLTLGLPEPGHLHRASAGTTPPCLLWPH